MMLISKISMNVCNIFMKNKDMSNLNGDSLVQNKGVVAPE